MTEVVKVIEVNGRKFELREPTGYEVDLMVTRYYDGGLQPIREKIAEANLALLKMCYGLSEEEAKNLPNSVYRRLIKEAADYFAETMAGLEEYQKK